MRFRTVLLVMAMLPWTVSAQQDSAARAESVGGVVMATFHFEREQLTPPKWGLNVADDGKGVYYEGADSDSAVRADVTISWPTWQRIAGAYERVKTTRCETHMKNIAKTGVKRLSYKFASGDDWAACEFNYSDTDAVNEAVSAFQAIAATMQFGERLKREHRFDRLGLDAEMLSLEAEMKDGRAIEVANIAGVLQSLVDDDRVIDRVRRKAARMIVESGAAPAPVK